MEPGQYVLIVSPKADIETEGCAIEAFSVLRYAVIGCGPSAAFSGYLVDNATGMPVANQSVSLLDGLWVKAKTKTDRHGYFAFRFKPKDDYYARYYVKVGGGGATSVHCVTSRCIARVSSSVRSISTIISSTANSLAM